MIEIILVEPKTPGNLGAVARAMKNFDFRKLVLIKPHCSVTNIEARKRAKHGADILEAAVVRTPRYLKNMDYLIGTTAITLTNSGKMAPRTNVFGCMSICVILSSPCLT